MLRVPISDESEQLADWLEASLLSSTASDRIADADIRDVFEEAGRDSDTCLDVIQQLLRERERILGTAYPVAREGQGFRRRGNWNNFLCYSFLLFVSMNQSYAELRFRAGAQEPSFLFENLALRALSTFFGAIAVRVGAPRVAPVPASLPHAIEYLCREVGESARVRGGLEQHAMGDDGLDIWFVKPFGDGRASSFSLLAQCAIGDNWKAKRGELRLEIWNRHVDWHATPMLAFAVPFQIPRDSWRETAATSGMVIDRLRIAKSIGMANPPRGFVGRVRTWTRARILETIRCVGILQ